MRETGKQKNKTMFIYILKIRENMKMFCAAKTFYEFEIVRRLRAKTNEYTFVCSLSTTKESEDVCAPKHEISLFATPVYVCLFVVEHYENERVKERQAYGKKRPRVAPWAAKICAPEPARIMLRITKECHVFKMSESILENLLFILDMKCLYRTMRIV